MQARGLRRLRHLAMKAIQKRAHQPKLMTLRRGVLKAAPESAKTLECLGAWFPPKLVECRQYQVAEPEVFRASVTLEALDPESYRASVATEAVEPEAYLALGELELVEVEASLA